MELRELELEGVFEITLQPHTDSRGFFMRTYEDEFFVEQGLYRKWVHENLSLSIHPNTIRGLHFQFPPNTEAKLVRCTQGAILDVFVDLRLSSSTFGQWGSLELSQSNRKMVLIPRGFAHGFRTLTEDSEVLYKVDSVYAPEAESGIIWNDPELNIDWGVEEPILSPKDSELMTFRAFRNKYLGIDLRVGEAREYSFV